MWLCRCAVGGCFPGREYNHADARLVIFGGCFPRREHGCADDGRFPGRDICINVFGLILLYKTGTGTITQEAPYLKHCTCVRIAIIV